MTYTISDYLGNVFGFNQETGLISKNSNIVSGEDYEPCFSNSPSGPVFTGIYFKKSNQVLVMSGRLVKITDPETL